MEYGRERKFVDASARLVTVGSADAANTTLTVGKLYRLTLIGTDSALAGAACRWGSSAVTAGAAGSSFLVQSGESLIVRAPHTTLRAIRISTGDGTLFAHEIEEGT